MSGIRAWKEVVAPTLIGGMFIWNTVTLEGIRCEISKIRAILAQMEEMLDPVDATLDGLDTHPAHENHRVSHRELLQEIHRQLEVRFDESDEGGAYGGPALAVDRLMLRARPDFDAALSYVLDSSRRSESPMLLTQDISNDLWERRMQFLERTGTTLP